METSSSFFTGELKFPQGSATGNWGSNGGPIRGTVADDVVRINDDRGIVDGEFTVTGDEMTGSIGIGVARPVTLRRIDPSSSR